MKIFHSLKCIFQLCLNGWKLEQGSELISPTHVRVGKQVMTEGMSNSPLVATEDGQVPVESAPIVSLRTE